MGISSWEKNGVSLSAIEELFEINIYKQFTSDDVNEKYKVYVSQANNCVTVYVLFLA